MSRHIRLLPALFALTCATPAVANPAIWAVSDDDSTVWLFGSFHILPPDAEWRTALFENIYSDADKIVFETDVRPPATMQFGADAFARGVYSDGTLLTDVISDELEATLRAEAATIGLPVGSVLAMRPWLATNTISVLALASEGYNQEGVEFLLQPELSDDRLVFLEASDQQLDVLAGAPEDEQVAMLQSTLEELSTLPKQMQKMVDSWANGTPDEMGEMFLMEMGGFEDAFLDRLLYARNQNWLAPIEAMLAEDARNLIIVGAAHLIGEGSVIDLLEEAGYRIKRIQ